MIFLLCRCAAALSLSHTLMCSFAQHSTTQKQECQKTSIQGLQFICILPNLSPLVLFIAQYSLKHSRPLTWSPIRCIVFSLFGLLSRDLCIRGPLWWSALIWISSSPVRSAVDWTMTCFGPGCCIFLLVEIKQKAFTTDLSVSVHSTVHVHICVTAQTDQSEMLRDRT